MPAEWGAAALDVAGGVSGLAALAGRLGLAKPEELAVLVAAKLGSERIEDLRLDF